MEITTSVAGDRGPGLLGRATPASGAPCRHRLHFRLRRGRLCELLAAEARLERGDQVGRRGSGLDLDALDLSTRHLLLDRLQEPLPVLILVVLGLELRPGELPDEALGERTLLVADLRFGTAVD